MAEVRPLTMFLGKPGSPGAMSRSEAARKAGALKRLIEQEGWEVFLELIQTYQRNEQRVMMVKPANENNVGKERKIGEWRGLELGANLVAGMIALGERAAQEMESGQAAEAAS